MYFRRRWLSLAENTTLCRCSFDGPEACWCQPEIDMLLRRSHCALGPRFRSPRLPTLHGCPFPMFTSALLGPSPRHRIGVAFERKSIKKWRSRLLRHLFHFTVDSYRLPCQLRTGMLSISASSSDTSVAVRPNRAKVAGLFSAAPRTDCARASV